MKGNHFTITPVDTSTWLTCTRSIIAKWTLLALALLLLVGCANAGNPQGPTPPQTATTPGTHLSTATPQLTQQYEFTEQDSGRTVTYSVTSRFGISLNEQRYPKKNLQVSCSPPETIGSVSNLPSVSPPLYAVRYQGIQPGQCTIKNGTFLLTVRIVA